MSTHTALTVAQAAQRAGVCRATIRRRIADGSLPAFRLGPRMIRIQADAVDALYRPMNPPVDPIETAIQALVEAAPPLSDTQRDNLRVLLAGGGAR